MTFFLEFFGIDTDKRDHEYTLFPTFEEILGILEIAVTEEESFRNWGTSPFADAQEKPRVQHMHELLIFLIAETLDLTLQGGRPHHEKLLAELAHLNRLQHVTFISLNYDILMDNAILDLHPMWDIDYLVDFSNVKMGNDMQNSTWHAPRSDRALRLLKLHGSLNWLFCPTCRDLTLTPKQKGICELKWKPAECCCRKCDTLAVPIVIPPTYLKVLSNLYLRQIWHAAEQELIAAERIVFCGYSFPDADIHIRYLLKRAEMNRTNPPPQVFIVNNYHKKASGECDVERNRYLRFFRHKEQVHWTNLSFQEFAADPQNIYE